MFIKFANAAQSFVLINPNAVAAIEPYRGRETGVIVGCEIYLTSGNFFRVLDDAETVLQKIETYGS